GLLLAARLLQGAGGGTVGVLHAYVTDSADQEDRAKSLGWLTAATSLGVVIGPAFGSFLTVAWGHRAPGLGAATLCVAISVFAWRYLAESRDEDAQLADEGSRPRAGRQALARVLSHAAEPASRLIWIYAIGMGA